MRNQRLHQYVSQLIESTWNEDNGDVAEAVLNDEGAFGALCYRLNQAGDGSEHGIEAVWSEMVKELSENDLDFLADGAQAPAAYLASKVG